jgi:iron complex outermembrane receptor protein
VQQFQSIPVATQLRPSSPGGVIDLDGAFYGGDLRWNNHSTLADRALDLTAGVTYDRQNQLRQGYNNFVGTTLGVQGALRRDEDDDVYNVDEYAQATWDFADRWSLDVGARHSKVTFSSVDHYVTAGQSRRQRRRRLFRHHAGSRTALSRDQPLASVRVVRQCVRNADFNELGYRPDGTAGINFNLVPANSRNGEIGSKLLLGKGEFDVALYQADTDHEIAVATSSGGRTTYQNVDRARRKGLEAKLDYPLAERWRIQAAYTIWTPRSVPRS